jgi:hypothetical protein
VKKEAFLNRREADVRDSAYCDYTERAGAYSVTTRTCKLGFAMMELVYCFDFKSTGTTLQLMDIQDEGALQHLDWLRHVPTKTRPARKM